METTVYKNAFLEVVEVLPQRFMIKPGEGRSGSSVVPIVGDKYIMIKNNRYTTGVHEIEFPGGGRHEGESFGECGARECHEETGYAITESDLLFVGHQINNVALVRDELAIYYADVSHIEQGEILDRGEVYEVLHLSENEVLDMISSGEIRDAFTIACFFRVREMLKVHAM